MKILIALLALLAGSAQASTYHFEYPVIGHFNENAPEWWETPPPCEPCYSIAHIDVNITDERYLVRYKDGYIDYTFDILTERLETDVPYYLNVNFNADGLIIIAMDSVALYMFSHHADDPLFWHEMSPSYYTRVGVRQVPEPAMLALMLVGLAGLGLRGLVK